MRAANGDLNGRAGGSSGVSMRLNQSILIEAPGSGTINANRAGDLGLPNLWIPVAMPASRDNPSKQWQPAHTKGVGLVIADSEQSPFSSQCLPIRDNPAPGQLPRDVPRSVTL